MTPLKTQIEAEAFLSESLKLAEAEGNRARANLLSLIIDIRPATPEFDVYRVLDLLDEYLSARVKQAFCEDKIHGRPLL